MEAQQMTETTSPITKLEQLEQAAADVNNDTLYVPDLARALVATMAVVKEQAAELEQLRGLVIKA
jgi:hypothetical protein